MSDTFTSVCYKKNFLKEVIARVDLLTPLPGLDATLPAILSELAVNTFPIPEPRNAVQRQVQIGPAGVASSEARFKEWRFHAKDRTKTLSIGPQALFIQHTKYETYERLKQEFIPFLDAVVSHFGRVQSSRVGLRYVNAIELSEPNPTEWSAYLAPDLLSLFNFPIGEDRTLLSRVFHNLELAFEPFTLRYRLGMHNPDYPARIRQKIFILDLDAYTQSAMDLREVGPLLDDFHATIQKYFEHSITKTLRSYMNAD